MTRRRSSSWKRTTVPSAVRWQSDSMYAAPDGVGGGDRGEGVLDHAVRSVLRRHEAAVREDPRVRGTLEPAVGHGAGGAGRSSSGVAVGVVRSAMSVTDPANAVLMPLSASVNSLGMIQSLLEALSAIFGRVCRYW